MNLLDKIKHWNLKRKIPKSQRNGKKWRYAKDGVTKIPVNDNEELKKYELERKRIKDKDKDEL